MNELTLSRSKLVRGFHTKHAKTLLFLIEARVAHCVQKSCQPSYYIQTEASQQNHKLDYLEAFTLGRELPLKPTIQQIERYSSQWESLIPLHNPAIQASLAYLLGEQYRCHACQMTGIRQALNWDDPKVKEAFEQLYHQPLESIYASRLSWGESLRWQWSKGATRLENLPPFWTAFALTFTELLGVGILALPIALAQVGAWEAMLLIICVGLVNMFTIACMGEAFARSGQVRYGEAFLGGVVHDYLGRVGAQVLSLTFLLDALGALLVFYMGLSLTLQAITTVSGMIWIPLIFAVGVYVISRGTLHTTLASALMIGFTNTGLILLITFLALLRFNPDDLSQNFNLFSTETGLNSSSLQWVFGVLLTAFFGHTNISHYAKRVLHHDPSSRSLIWGAVGAQMTAMLFFCGWVLVIKGVLTPAELATETGTVLTPLAAELGVGVYVLGLMFAVLVLGMGTIHASFGVVSTLMEWLPQRVERVIILPYEQGRLRFRRYNLGTDDLTISLTYLGMENFYPLFRLELQAKGGTRRWDITFLEDWDSDEWVLQLPENQRSGVNFALQVQRANREAVQIAITTSMHLSYDGEWEQFGLSMSNLLELPDATRQIVNWMLHQRQNRFSFLELLDGLQRPPDELLEQLENLVGTGLIRREEAPNGDYTYLVAFARRRGRQLSTLIWKALDNQAAETTIELPSLWGRFQEATLGVFSQLILTQVGRLMLAFTPILLPLGVAEWFMYSKNTSFSEPLAVTGLITPTLIAGLFALLLLVASRQKGDFLPQVTYRVLGNRVALGGVYGLFLANLGLHGLLIWDGWIKQGIALGAAALILAGTLFLWSEKWLLPRLIVGLEVRNGQPRLKVHQAGQLMPMQVTALTRDNQQIVYRYNETLPSLDQLQTLTITLPRTLASEAKIWMYRLNPVGDAEPMPAQMDVHFKDGATQRYDLKLTQGQVLLPLAGTEKALTLILNPESPTSVVKS